MLVPGFYAFSPTLLSLSPERVKDGLEMLMRSDTDARIRSSQKSMQLLSRRSERKRGKADDSLLLVVHHALPYSVIRIRFIYRRKMPRHGLCVADEPVEDGEERRLKTEDYLRAEGFCNVDDGFLKQDEAGVLGYLRW